MRQLVDEVVRGDARFAWRSGTEIALAEWEDAASLLDMPLERAEYVVFDLETTGTTPGASRIVEVGAVRVSALDAGRAIRAAGRSRRADAGGDHRPHRHLAAHLRGRPRIDRVLADFLRFCAGAVLVAHNARFDVGFVDAELRRLRGGRLAAPVIDTVALARRLLGERVPA